MQTNTLFTQYVNTVNQALGEHRNEFPWSHLIQTSENLIEGKDIGIAVYKGDVDHPHDHFTVRMEDGTFHIVGRGKEPADANLKIPRQHLEEVADNPSDYVDNPMKLDLSWLRHRVGMA